MGIFLALKFTMPSEFQPMVKEQYTQAREKIEKKGGVQ